MLNNHKSQSRNAVIGAVKILFPFFIRRLTYENKNVNLKSKVLADFTCNFSVAGSCQNQGQ
jgi:hypothetical protein